MTSQRGQQVGAKSVSGQALDGGFGNAILSRTGKLSRGADANFISTALGTMVLWEFSDRAIMSLAFISGSGNTISTLEWFQHDDANLQLCF